MIDDVFPNLLTGFRIAEFNAYLEYWTSAIVLSNANWFPTATGAIGFGPTRNEYLAKYPYLSSQVRPLSADRRISARLGYCVFINNAEAYLPIFERYHIPFLFTLYPGAGFQLNDRCANRIRRVTASPMFRGLIVTQTVVREFVTSLELADPALTHMIWGVPVPPGRCSRERPRYGLDKETYDICFAAHRYTPDGRDKGYDVFVNAARNVARALPSSRFHVVGPWSPDDYDIGGLEDKITFYGSMPITDLRTFLSNIDIAVFPNRPFCRAPDDIDGFPLGTAIEAGLAGCAVLATNQLHEVGPFTDGRHLVIAEPDADDVAAGLIRLAQDPSTLKSLGNAAQEGFERIYGGPGQIEPRIRLLAQHLDLSGVGAIPS